MTIEEKALRLRAQIEKNAATMDDEEAVEYADLFPAWSESGVYAAGDRVRYDGELYRCLTAHTAQGDWTPEAAASLWARVLAGQEGTEIGEWEQPDSTNPYMTGERVLFNGLVYESLIDNNVWSPADYPAGWQQIEG